MKAVGSTPEANDVVVEAWNTVLFDKFERFKHLLVAGLAGHSDELLSRGLFRPGERVLDVGSGFGDSTIKIAGLVGPSGEAVGVDCAERFIAAGEHDAAAAGVRNAKFFVADVQDDDLRGPYDQAFARFGTMFFMSPVPALRNIRNALEPGGHFAQIVWRTGRRARRDRPGPLRARAVLDVRSRHGELDDEGRRLRRHRVRALRRRHLHRA
jgi:ubiquinone/menaquinone biosynthesis C-methylase UbiE